MKPNCRKWGQRSPNRRAHKSDEVRMSLTGNFPTHETQYLAQKPLKEKLDLCIKCKNETVKCTQWFYTKCDITYASTIFARVVTSDKFATKAVNTNNWLRHLLALLVLAFESLLDRAAKSWYFRGGLQLVVLPKLFKLFLKMLGGQYPGWSPPLFASLLLDKICSTCNLCFDVIKVA